LARHRSASSATPSAASPAVRLGAVIRGSRPAELTVTRASGAKRAIPSFHFGGVGGDARTSLAPAQRDKFKADFCSETARLSAWAAEQNWPSSSPAELHVFVSDDYKLSKSLVPAWFGHPGRMEFSAWRVKDGEAAIMHELVHVYFPNGNRLLAEGLAVYLQDRIGGNSAFPNFDIPLHEAVRECLPEMVPEFSWDDPGSLDLVHLAELDAIATPDALALSVGQERYGVHYGKNPYEQAHIYAIAGSFVQFLIETHGMDKLRALFMRTPLVPLQRTAGSPDRWIEAYGLSLTELEQHWKSLIIASAPRPACRSRAESGEAGSAARSRPRLSKKLRKGEVHDRNQSKADLGAAGERKKRR
jgi:hypothetical protein